MSDTKISPEAMRLVSGIINQADQEMKTASRELGAQAGEVITAYRGAGTQTAMQNYENLGSAGTVLAEILGILSADLGVTQLVGLDTDDAARAQMTQVIDPNVVRGI